MVLTTTEYDLFHLFEEPHLGWGDILSQQLRHASVSRVEYTNSIFLDFVTDCKAPKVNVLVEVPIEIIIGTTVVPHEKCLCRIDGFIVTDISEIMIPDESAYAVRLHFQKGHIKELEIFSLSSDTLDLSKLYTSIRTYLIRDPGSFMHLYKA